MSVLDSSDAASFKSPRRSRQASIRSTVSTRSPRPNVWRSLRVRKDSATQTITAVIATPQISGTAGPSARERMEARMEAYHLPIASTSDVQHDIDVIPEAPVADANSISFPVSVSPTPSRSSSWFGSLSRAKGKEKLVAASAPDLLASASPSVAVSEPVTSSNPERADPFLPDTTSIPVNKHPTTKRSWFSSSPSQPSPLRTASPPQPIPQPIHIPSNDTSVSSSLDSSVPLPVATPPADVPVSFPEATPSTVSGRQRLSSLNPAVAHFGLALPSLAASKAVASNFSQVTTGTSQLLRTPTLTDMDIDAIETTQTVVQDSTVTSSGVEATPLTSATIRTSTMETTLGASTTQSRDVNVEVQSSSWWEYVGWSSAPQSTQPRPQDKQEEQGESTPKPAVQQISEESEPPAAASIDELGPVRNDEVAAPVSNEQSSSWYSPWAWYGLAPSDPNPASSNEEKTPEAPSPPLDLAEAASEPSPPSPFVPDSRTAAQQRYWTSFFSASYSQPPLSSNPAVETGADAPEITVESTPPPVPKTSSSVALPNPIADSMTSQSASWVSFFNTGTLGYISRKTVASGEPEVMEIDVDEVPAEQEVSKTPPAIVVPTAPPSTGTKPEAKPAKLAKEELEGKPMKEGPSPSKAIKDETPARPTKTAKPSSKPSAPPLTISDSVKRQVVNNTGTTSSKRSSSPAPSATSRQSKPASIAPPRTPPANLVLPTWADTFHTAPRSVVPQRFIDAQGRTVGRAMEKTMKFVSSVLFASDGSSSRKRRSSIAKGKAHGSGEFEDWGLGLPRAWDVLKPASAQGRPANVKEGNFEDVLRGCRNVCVIGIHGWFPGAVMRSVLGEPTGTSTKFVNMMVTALEDFQEEYNVRLEKISKIPLEGEGTIDRRVEKLYATLTSNTEWMDDLHAADVIFVATHSQGSIVSTHILNRLINEGHIQTGGYDSAKPPSSPSAGTYAPPPAPRQRVCCLALCGIHLGPLRYLNSSSLLLPYIQYFESAAAKELFEFQDTESEVSRAYVTSLENVLDNGVKMVYVASLNDQVVPVHSGIFTAASHNLILRSLFIDGDAYHSSDFLSNLLVLLIRVLNAGLTERGLVTHLSEATAGSLNGVGHSTAYEEIGNYTLAVKYLFLTNGGFETHPKLSVEPFNASTEQNDYEIPWSLRDMIADPQVAHFFSKEISQLAADFRHWSPKTTILRDVKRKLQPIQRLPSSFSQPKL